MAIALVFFDSMAGMMLEHAAVLTDSHVADVGVDAEQIPVPGGQHQKGTNGERREERAHETAQQQAKQRLRPPARSTGSSRSLRNCLPLAHPGATLYRVPLPLSRAGTLRPRAAAFWTSADTEARACARLR